MRLEETHNIHRNINCIFPWFKSKRLCEKGIHNWRIKRNEVQFSLRQIEGNTYQLDMIDSPDRLVCFCCGKEERLEE